MSAVALVKKRNAGETEEAVAKETPMEM